MFLQQVKRARTEVNCPSGKSQLHSQFPELRQFSDPKTHKTKVRPSSHEEGPYNNMAIVPGSDFPSPSPKGSTTIYSAGESGIYFWGQLEPENK